MKKLILLSILVSGIYAKGFCQTPKVVLSDKSGWHKIGETTVGFNTDADEIAVIGADRFGFIKINVTDASVNLISFDIYFEGGEKQSVVIGKDIKGPGETRVVQLNGGERRIQKVTFIYKTVPNSTDKKAHLELWGLKTNTDKKTNAK